MKTIEELEEDFPRLWFDCEVTLKDLHEYDIIFIPKNWNRPEDSFNMLIMVLEVLKDKSGPGGRTSIKIIGELLDYDGIDHDDPSGKLDSSEECYNNIVIQACKVFVQRPFTFEFTSTDSQSCQIVTEGNNDAMTTLYGRSVILLLETYEELETDFPMLRFDREVLLIDLDDGDIIFIPEKWNGDNDRFNMLIKVLEVKSGPKSCVEIIGVLLYYDGIGLDKHFDVPLSLVHDYSGAVKYYEVFLQDPNTVEFTSTRTKPTLLKTIEELEAGFPKLRFDREVELKDLCEDDVIFIPENWNGEEDKSNMLIKVLTVRTVSLESAGWLIEIIGILLDYDGVELDEHFTTPLALADVYDVGLESYKVFIQESDIQEFTS